MFTRGGETLISYGEHTDIKTEVTSAIRQGCMNSTTLFNLVTYKIIKKLEELNNLFRDELFNINMLFANNELLLASSVEEANRMINILMTNAAECLLNINKNKSKTVLINMKEQLNRVEGTEVTSTIKYFGILINNTRNCFTKQEEKR